jgi:cellobiose phosphorylase
MKYGYFDDANFEYVIERPDTPRSWTNYIGSREFGGVITNNAGGFSFYKTSGQGRFTRLQFNSIPNDQPGRYFYIRDNESGDYWSSSWQPVGKPLDEYKTKCHFGMGYARIVSDYADIQSESLYYVPLDATVECWKLKLTNTSDRPRKLSVFTYAEFTSEWHIFMDAFNLQYSMYTMRNEFTDGFIQNSTNGSLPEDPDNFKNRDQSRWWWMTLAGADVTGYDLDRETFIGPYRAYHNPVAVESGECQNSTAYGDNGCGGLKTDIELAPGESREVMVLMGIGKSGKEGKAALEQYGLGTTERELERIRDYWAKRIGTLKVSTPDPEMNTMLNVWGPYNALINFYWCRSASLIYSGDERDGFGYRDTVQDLTGCSALIADDVRGRLELMLTGQESNGGAMPEVKPYAHEPGKMPKVDPEHQRSDDMLWMFNSIPAYVNETGDFDFYNKSLPYCDEGEDTVFDHLRRAIEFNLERTGANGLPCGLFADWDDCIRMGFHGETTFVAIQVRHGLNVLVNVAKQLGRDADAKWAANELSKMDEKLQALTWDGKWFLRGYDDQGRKVGSAECDEAKIFHPIQSWAVLAGVATDEQAQTAMSSVDELLYTEFGCMALMPPVVKAPCKELRMVLLNPGQKENAGIFSHSQGWVVMANCLLGEGDRAYKVYRANLPARFNDIADVRETEPYVYCQSTSSKYSQREGKGHLPWLTGSAGWSYYAPTQYILGIRPELNGLRIDPCIPSDWPGFDAVRKFRSKTVSISVKNPNGKNRGVAKLTLNGEPVEGNLLPLDKLQDSNEVVCELG